LDQTEVSLSEEQTKTKDADYLETAGLEPSNDNLELMKRLKYLAPTTISDEQEREISIDEKKRARVRIKKNWDKYKGNIKVVKSDFEEYKKGLKTQYNLMQRIEDDMRILDPHSYAISIPDSKGGEAVRLDKFPSKEEYMIRIKKDCSIEDNDAERLAKRLTDFVTPPDFIEGLTNVLEHKMVLDEGLKKAMNLSVRISNEVLEHISLLRKDLKIEKTVQHLFTSDSPNEEKPKKQIQSKSKETPKKLQK